MLNFQKKLLKNSLKHKIIIIDGKFCSGKSTALTILSKYFPLSLYLNLDNNMIRNIDVPRFHYMLYGQHDYTYNKIERIFENHTHRCFLRNYNEREKLLAFRVDCILFDNFEMLTKEESKFFFNFFLGKTNQIIISIDSKSSDCNKFCKKLLKRKDTLILKAKLKDNHFLPKSFINEMDKIYG